MPCVTTERMSFLSTVQTIVKQFTEKKNPNGFCTHDVGTTNKHFVWETTELTLEAW